MATSFPPASLSEMPLEIKIHIFEFLCDHCCEGWEVLRRNTDTRITRVPLRNLCLTSKSLKAAAEPILYHFFCGGGKFAVSAPSLTRFLIALTNRPELARSVKSLSVDSSNECNVKRASVFLETLFGNGDLSERTAQLDDSFRHNFVFASGIIQHAKNIEELEFSVGQHSDVIPVRLVHLKELSIHSNFPEGILSSRLTLPFFLNNPKLEKLTLSNFKEFGDYEPDALVSIKQLTLIRTSSLQFPALGKLLSATPNLHFFKFWNAAVDFYEAGDSIFRELLCRRDSLTSLTLDGILFSGNSAALKRLSKLETLDMTVFSPVLITNMDSLKFPPSLKHLILRGSDGEMHEFGKVIKRLGERLCEFPLLKRVDVILLIQIGWELDPKWFDPSRWAEPAAKDFCDARVQLSARILYRDQDAMRRNVLGRGWGKNVRGKRYTDAALE